MYSAVTLGFEAWIPLSCCAWLKNRPVSKSAAQNMSQGGAGEDRGKENRLAVYVRNFPQLHLTEEK